MLEVVRDCSKALVTIDRDIVASITDELRQKLKNLLSEGITELVIDLARVEMIDSVGLGLLISTHNSLNKVEGKLSMVNASKDLIEFFKNMRLDQYISVEAP